MSWWRRRRRRRRRKRTSVHFGCQAPLPHIILQRSMQGLRNARVPIQPHPLAETPPELLARCVLQALEGGCVITSSPSPAPLRHSNSSAAPVFLSLVCSCLPHCALRSGGHWRNDSETCSMREGWAGGGIRDEGACCCCYVASACHGLFCVRRLNCNESVLIQLSPSLRTSHPPYWRW